jgi:hypothetical protein
MAVEVTAAVEGAGNIRSYRILRLPENCFLAFTKLRKLDEFLKNLPIRSVKSW